MPGSKTIFLSLEDITVAVSEKGKNMNIFSFSIYIFLFWRIDWDVAKLFFFGGGDW